MLKRRGLSLIATSLILALGAAWLAHSWMQARLRSDASATDMPVVVAAMQIPFGTRVETRQLRVIKLPRDTPLGDHFASADAVVGLIAVQKILPGEILLRAQFSTHSVGSTLAALLRPDLRAISVRVDDVVGVAGFLLPGNHVDVVATRMVNQHAETKTVLSDLTVLAVDQTASPDKSTPVVVRAVTLAVTPQQAEVLVQAREQGSIQLTLRSPTATDGSAVVPPPSLASEASAGPANTARPFMHRSKSNAVRRKASSTAPKGTTIIRGTTVQHTPAPH